MSEIRLNVDVGFHWGNGSYYRAKRTGGIWTSQLGAWEGQTEGGLDNLNPKMVLIGSNIMWQ